MVVKKLGHYCSGVPLEASSFAAVAVYYSNSVAVVRVVPVSTKEIGIPYSQNTECVPVKPPASHYFPPNPICCDQYCSTQNKGQR